MSQEFKKDLRSVLLADKDGIDILRLNEEYKDLMGEDIKWDRNQFKNFESYISSLTDTCSVKRYGTSTIVYAVSTDKQQSLQKLIKGQNTNKNKSKRSKALRRPLFSRNSYASNSSSSTTKNSRHYVNRNTANINRSRYSNSSFYNNKNRVTSNYTNGTSKASFDSLSNDKVYDVRAKFPASNVNVIDIDNSKSSKQTTPFKKSNKSRLPFQIRDDEPIDYKYKLSLFVKERKLPDPIYCVTNYVERSRLIGYFSKVEVGDKSWYTYQDQIIYKTADGADRFVAKKALEELTSLEKSTSHLVSSKDHDIIDNISKLFANDLTPQYKYGIEEKYLSTYNCKLDDDWLKLIEESKKFDIEEHKIGNKKMVLIVSKTKIENKTEEINQVNNQTNGIQQVSDQMNEVDLEDKIHETENSNDLENVEVQQFGETQELPESLELSKDDYLEVLVLRATNSREIVLRLTNNTDDLDQLITDLQKYYNESKLGKRVENIVINKIYAAVFDGAVFRVQTIMFEGKEVYCYFLDDGIFEKIARSNLYEITNQFMKLSFQAFTVELDGLQNQSESLIRKFIDDKMKENNDVLCLIARVISFEEPITVRLYDTSNDDRDIDLNESIIEFLKNNNLPNYGSVPRAILPKINEENECEPFKVKPSLVINPHNFIVTMSENLNENSSYQQLNKQLQDFYSKSDEHVDLIESMIYPGLFVCVVDQNMTWYRGRVEELTNSGCTIYLIDEGRIIFSEIKNLQPLYSQFSLLPSIALRASLSNIIPINRDWNIDTIIYLKEKIENKEFEAIIQEVVSLDGETIIQIVLNDENGQSISDQLVNNGHAKSI